MFERQISIKQIPNNILPDTLALRNVISGGWSLILFMTTVIFWVFSTPVCDLIETGNETDLYFSASNVDAKDPTIRVGK